LNSTTKKNVYASLEVAQTQISLHSQHVSKRNVTVMVNGKNYDT